jgi:hypothetical protein
MSKNCCFIPSTPIVFPQVKTFIVPKGLTTLQTDAVYGYNYSAGRIFQVNMNYLIGKPRTILNVEALVDSLTRNPPTTDSNLFNPYFTNLTNAPGQNEEFGPIVIPANTDMMFFHVLGVGSNNDATGYFTYFYDQKGGFLYIVVPFSPNTTTGLPSDSFLLTHQSAASVFTNFPFRITYI